MKNKIQSLIIALVAFLTIPLAFAQDKITTLGQISAVYQSQGDMMTLNSTGNPLRVPIGSTGQVLSVSGGIPVWSSSPATTGASSAAAFTIGVRSDANRIFVFDAASDTALGLTYGDGSIAAQTFSILSATADAADSGSLCLGSGGACTNARGAYILAAGNEQASVGDITIASGAATASIISLNAGDNASVINLNVGAGLTNRLQISTTQLLAGVDYAAATGVTLSLQEATAGSACMGTATCNGATDVTTATTCSTTGSRIFLQRSSADTDGVGQMYVKSISNGVNFVVNCVTASDTSTFNWIIFHEAA